MEDALCSAVFVPPGREVRSVCGYDKWHDRLRERQLKVHGLVEKGFGDPQRATDGTRSGDGDEYGKRQAGLAEADVDLIVLRVDEVQGSDERADRRQNSRHAIQDFERFFDAA